MVNLNISSESGYELENIIVKDINGKEITVKDNKFTMPNADVTINVTFKKVSSSTITSDNDSKKIKNDEPKDNKDNGKATEDKEKDDTMSTAPFGQYGGKMVTITIIGIITMVGVIMYKKSKNIIIK